MHRWIDRLAHGMAFLGGLALLLTILLICGSVAGRVLNSALHGWVGHLAPEFSATLLNWGVGPIKGDFEIVEACIAFAIFAFLPLCQFTHGHADVDIFTARLSGRTNRALRMIIDIVFAAVLVLITVQLYNGMISKMNFGEETFILQFPVWWGYAASLCAAIVATIVGLYIAYSNMRVWFVGIEGEP